MPVNRSQHRHAGSSSGQTQTATNRSLAGGSAFRKRDRTQEPSYTDDHTHGDDSDDDVDVDGRDDDDGGDDDMHRGRKRLHFHRHDDDVNTALPVQEAPQGGRSLLQTPVRTISSDRRGRGAGVADGTADGAASGGRGGIFVEGTNSRSVRRLAAASRGVDSDAVIDLVSESESSTSTPVVARNSNGGGSAESGVAASRESPGRAGGAIGHASDSDSARGAMPAAAACDVVALVATPTSSEPASCESDVGSADDSEDATPDAAPHRASSLGSLTC